MTKNQKVLKNQIELNKKLAQLFKENNITKFNLTSVGNSIASGYSMVRTLMPMLLRNTSISETMTENGIDLSIRHFARAQDNNDEHIFNWLTTNIKESEIHMMNQKDYNGGPTSMPSPGIDYEGLETFYPTEMDNDFGLRDVVLESDDKLANIIIYNGCTGSFLDNVTRGGKLSRMLTYGIKRDTISLEATLKYIQANNRNNGTNTQVYICGAPNFLGLGISEVINIRLRKIAKNYANVTYVEPVKSKFLYKNIEVEKNVGLGQAQSFMKKHLLQPDIHYDEVEYLQLNNNIIESICDNYEVNEKVINVDRELFKLNKDLEFSHPEKIGLPEYVYNLVAKLIVEQINDIKSDVTRRKFVAVIKKYLKDRIPYDFYHVGKKNIVESIDDVSRVSNISRKN